MVYGVWSWLVDSLGSAVNKDGVPVVEARRVEMYTGSSTDDDKTRLVEAFKSPTGNVRVMVTTVAFGMGVNIPDVDTVVHWGAPRSFLGLLAGGGPCKAKLKSRHSSTCALQKKHN